MMEDEIVDFDIDEEDVMIDDIYRDIEKKYRNLIIY